jgi:hypothetical protein
VARSLSDQRSIATLLLVHAQAQNLPRNQTRIPTPGQTNLATSQDVSPLRKDDRPRFARAHNRNLNQSPPPPPPAAWQPMLSKGHLRSCEFYGLLHVENMASGYYFCETPAWML